MVKLNYGVVVKKKINGCLNKMVKVKNTMLKRMKKVTITKMNKVNIVTMIKKKIRFIT